MPDVNHPRPYIGRFAPSPTGQLHFGSLVAALGSYLQARSRGGQWIVRVEDIDPPREVPGSAEQILRDLDRLGMRPDHPVLFQSSRMDAYRKAWTSLLERNLAFRCACSRGMFPPSGIYPGTCRAASLPSSGNNRIRIRVQDTLVRFVDRVMGEQRENLATEVGDFVIRRVDGFPAYQLAVVVDDEFQGVTEVVRGADLMDSTPRQVFLQQMLRLRTPGYCHLPVAVLPNGEKLSKRLDSDPVNRSDPADSIRRALIFLGHQPPPRLKLSSLWQWALRHWDPRRVPAHKEIPVDGNIFRS